MTEAKLEKVRSLARASARGDAVVNLELIELDKSEAAKEGGVSCDGGGLSLGAGT